MIKMPSIGHPPPHALVLESERLLLIDLLNSPTGIAAMVSAPPPYDRKPFPFGGKWRGYIPSELKRRGIITRVQTAEGAVANPATRPNRNGNRTLAWRLINRQAALRPLAELDASRARRADRTLFDQWPDVHDKRSKTT